MTNALLFISLLLNILALFAIVILYQRQNKFFDIEKKQQTMLKEMEDVISTYLAEMREENEAFIENVKHLQKSEKKEIKHSRPLHTEIPVSPKPKIGNRAFVSQAVQAYKTQPNIHQGLELDLDLDTDEQETRQEVEAVQEPNLPPPPKSEPEPEPKPLSIEEQAELLQEQGYSLDEIAKMLEKGKTEIELLLKFRQKS